MFKAKLSRRESGRRRMMERFKIKVVLVAVVLGMSVAPHHHCEAGNPDHDLREGTFRGNWCGSVAEFVIKKQKGEDWKFEGTVEILSNGQVDRLTVEQVQNNSLHMVRFLSGKHEGDTQVMQTHPPETLSVGGKLTVNFPTRRTFGYGARLAGFLRMPVK